MPTTSQGKRSATLSVQLVEDGAQIHMFFNGFDIPPINFNRGTGTSGPRAYEKLLGIVDEAQRRESQ